MTSRRPFSLAGLGLVMAVAMTSGDLAAAREGEQASAQPPAATDARSTDKIRVAGTVRDQQSAIALPGVTVEVTGTNIVAVTDVDGRYTLDLAPGSYDVKIAMEGFEEQHVKLDLGAERNPTLDVALP